MTDSSVSSAQIIQHPRAAAEPVLQQKRSGRFPKMITSLNFVRYRKFIDSGHAAFIASEVARIEGQIERVRVVIQKTESDSFARIEELSKPDMTPKEREALAESIRRDRLPFAPSVSATAAVVR